VGDQRAEEQHGHPGRGGHAEGMPPQADQDARGVIDVRDELQITG
jgi:hypothetical protein